MQSGFFLDNKSTADKFFTMQSTAMKVRPYVLRVQMPSLNPDEVVCVTGSIPELGNWAPERCRVLDRSPGDIWSTTIKVPINEKVYYRYSVCIIVEPNVHVIVRSWEANLFPRVIKPEYPSPKDDPEMYGDYRGSVQIDKGWLIKGSVVVLEMSNNPFKFWRPRYQGRTTYVKVTPVNLIKHCPSVSKSSMDCFDESQSVDHLEDPPKFSFVEVASLTSDDNHEFQPQKQFGEKFIDGDVLTFKTYLINPSTTAFLIDIYIYGSKSTDDEPPVHAGFTYLLPGAIESSKGTVVLPLTSMKQRPLGELRVKYLIIEPLPNVSCTMERTYERYWKKNRKGLNIGHRGSGNSFKSDVRHNSEIRENTIASLKQAIDKGADYVEFDVQLTKDSVPVIYHDFTVCIAMHKKKNLQETDLLELPLRDLTLDQLRMLKIYHKAEQTSNFHRFVDDDLEEHQPFPTLRSALETLSERAGFNIEIKCPSRLMDGSEELPFNEDLNTFVDKIVETVLKYGGSRNIVFSCFNQDAVAMVRAKQNRYPVMFLTQGDTKRYPRYEDPRCWSIQNAVRFAKMHEILGVSAHTEDILRDPSLAMYALNKGLVLFCWGDDLDDPNVIDYLKNLGLHGIIYDKILEYLEKDKDSIYLMDGRDSQKDLIRLAAQANELPVQTKGSQFMRASVDYADDVSSAASFDSLETSN